MEYKSKAYSKLVRILFPIVVTLIICIVAPMGPPLMGSLMFGNFMRESRVVERLAKSAENEAANIVTVLLGLTVGGTMLANRSIVGWTHRKITFF